MNPLALLLQKMNDQEVWEKTISLNRNDYLKMEGETNTNLYFILSGSLRLFVADDHEEHTIRLGYTHNIITALDSFISEQASDIYIQAIKKTSVLVVSKTTFMNFIRSSNENLNLWISISNQLIYDLLERERDILTASPAERYKRVLKRSPQLFQEIPNKYIASYLRMTPETLSRVKKA